VKHSQNKFRLSNGGKFGAWLELSTVRYKTLTHSLININNGSYQQRILSSCVGRDRGTMFCELHGIRNNNKKKYSTCRVCVWGTVFDFLELIFSIIYVGGSCIITWVFVKLVTLFLP
jgi:hypothetical protein